MIKIEKELAEAKQVLNQLRQWPARSVGDIKRVSKLTRPGLSVKLKYFANNSAQRCGDQGLVAG